MKYVLSMDEASAAVVAELERRGVSGAVARVVWNVRYSPASGAPEIDVEVELKLKGEAAEERR